jgi:hypothetical protein
MVVVVEANLLSVYVLPTGRDAGTGRHLIALPGRVDPRQTGSIDTASSCRGRGPVE